MPALARLSPIPTMTPPPPESTPAAPAAAADPRWDEAFLRVESYLRAHGLESPVRLNAITAEIIRAARAVEPARAEPVPAAMEVAHARIGAWLARAGLELDWNDQRSRAQGRLALIIADLPGRWADYFLSPGPVPGKLAVALASGQLLPGPELRLTTMPPAPLEFGTIEAAARRHLVSGAQRSVRALVSWLLIAGLLGIAWAASH